jgi:hypothetical protein
MLAVKFVGIGVTCGGWKREMRGLDAIVLTAVERGGWHWMELALAAYCSNTTAFQDKRADGGTRRTWILKVRGIRYSLHSSSDSSTVRGGRSLEKATRWTW